jgi:hypothetical protein
MSAFTQKHYEAIAKVLADTYPEPNPEPWTGGGHRRDAIIRLQHHEAVTDALAKLFAADNDRFDDQKFYRWSEPSPFTVEAVDPRE